MHFWQIAIFVQGYKLCWTFILILTYNCIPRQSRGYLGFESVTPPPQRFSSACLPQKLFVLGLSNLVCGYIWGMSPASSKFSLGLQLIGQWRPLKNQNLSGLNWTRSWGLHFFNLCYRYIISVSGYRLLCVACLVCQFWPEIPVASGWIGLSANCMYMHTKCYVYCVFLNSTTTPNSNSETVVKVPSTKGYPLLHMLGWYLRRHNFRNITSVNSMH